jgi:hypothetical protein
MKKLIILLIATTTLSSCNSRRKKIEKISIKKEFLLKKEFDSIQIKKDSVVVIKEQEKKIESSIDSNNGDIIIRGNATLEVPFEYHNIVGKDTLNSILIKGNAEFEVKNKWKDEKVKSEQSNIKKNINIVAKIARTAVAQETISKASEEIKSTTKDIKSNGFPLVVYILGAAIVLFLILFAVYNKKFSLYLKSFNIFKKKKNG